MRLICNIMLILKQHVRFFACFVGLFLCIGCGSDTSQAKYSVTANVTIDGQPAQGTCTLYPADIKSPLKSTGGLIKDGKFIIGPENGAAAGEYNILIIISENVNPNSVQSASKVLSPLSDVRDEDSRDIEIGRYTEKVVISEKSNYFTYTLTKSQLKKDIEL